jgi:hypothetical protein
VGKKKLQKMKQEAGAVEKILKAMTKALENNHLNP